MKRFYNDVAIAGRGNSFEVTLDGKPIRTPLRKILLLPTRAIAEAIAAEWERAEGTVDPAAMQLTRLASATTDHGPERDRGVIDNILKFADSDLLSYRAEVPELAQRQAAGWDPILAWLADAYGAHLAVTSGIQPIDHPPDALSKLRKAVSALDDFALMALIAAAAITGSLALALAMLGGRLSAKEALGLSRIDETYQSAKWGEDEEAARRAARLARELEAAANFHRLSRP